MQKDCRSNPCQRHGTALNLNVHLHILALDGVYTFDGERPRFHRVAPPAGEELERLLDALIRRITRTLVRSGALVAQEYDGEEQLWLDLDPDGDVRMPREAGCRERPVRAAGLHRLAIAALVPRPRTHLVRLHGLFAPNARHRRLVVPAPALEPAPEDAETTRSQTRSAMTWAQRAAPACSRSTSAAARAAAGSFVCSPRSPTRG